MANKSFSILLVILFWGSTFASRTKLLTSRSTITALKPAIIDGGVCSSLIETQGYACEEHLVGTVHFFHSCFCSD